MPSSIPLQGAAAVLNKQDYAAILAMLNHVSIDSMKVRSDDPHSAVVLASVC